MNNTISKIAMLLLVGVISLPLKVTAQKKDSLALLREFLQVSTSYKQAPLYMELEMKNSTNFITSEQDTLSAVGKFYLSSGSSYMQFGELEQLVTDSIAIMVSSRLQRIIVNTDPRPLLNQMEVFAGALLKNSSIKDLSKKYQAEAEINKYVSVIELNSRELLYPGSLPKETIEMLYETNGKKPAKITSVKRTLIPLSEDGYQTVKSQQGMDKFLVATDDKRYFLIKEQATSFIYKSIVQEANIKIPVAISDRVTKNTHGEFEPVKAFEEYDLTTN